jgi:hypothetical protein
VFVLVVSFHEVLVDRGRGAQGFAIRACARELVSSRDQEGEVVVGFEILKRGLVRRCISHSQRVKPLEDGVVQTHVEPYVAHTRGELADQVAVGSVVASIPPKRLW